MSEATNDIKSGWGWPMNSRKAHYFFHGTSLCRRMAYFGNQLEQGNDNSPDNCAECKKRKAKWLSEQHHRTDREEAGE